MKNRKNDIERYLRGELSSAEMHALEKEALNDPFLAEALEGVEQAGPDNFLFDLHALNRSVHHRARKTKNKSLRMWGWTAGMAATVLLVAVSGFLVVSLIRNSPNDRQAMREEAAPPLKDRRAATDTVAGPLDTAKTAPDERGGKQEEGRQLSANEGGKSSEPVTEITEAQVAKDSGLLAENSIAENDITATFSKPIADDPAGVNHPSVAGAGTNALKQRDEPAAAKRSKKESEASDPIPAAASFRVAQPASGMAAFKKYLLDSMRYPAAALENHVAGEVRVGFTVHPNGQISGFEVIKGIGYGCDQELIRLIKQGPPWKPAIQGDQPVGDTVEVQLRFELPETAEKR